jgi:hypothetical protein
MFPMRKLILLLVVTCNMSYGQTPTAIQEIEASKIDSDIRIDELIEYHGLQPWFTARIKSGF